MGIQPPPSYIYNPQYMRLGVSNLNPTHSTLSVGEQYPGGYDESLLSSGEELEIESESVQWVGI